MNKIVFVILFVILNVTCIFSSLGFSGTSDSLTLCALEYPPYSTLERDDRGTLTADLRDVLSERHRDIHFLFYRWDSAIEKASMGYCVGYYPVRLDDIDNRAFFLSIPVIEIEIGLMINNSKPIDYRDYAHLFSKYRVGIVWMPEYPLRVRSYEDKFVIFKREEDLVSSLSSGTIDLAIGDVAVLLYYSDRLGIKNLHTYRIIERQHLYIAFSRKFENVDVAIDINNLLMLK